MSGTQIDGLRQFPPSWACFYFSATFGLAIRFPSHLVSGLPYPSCKVQTTIDIIFLRAEALYSPGMVKMRTDVSVTLFPSDSAGWMAHHANSVVTYKPFGSYRTSPRLLKREGEELAKQAGYTGDTLLLVFIVAAIVSVCCRWAGSVPTFVLKVLRSGTCVVRR